MIDELRERIYKILGDSPVLSPLHHERVQVVDAIVSGLGLREEWATRHESGGGAIYATEQQAREDLASFVYRPSGVDDPGSGRLIGIERRYVTSWEVSK